MLKNVMEVVFEKEKSGYSGENETGFTEHPFCYCLILNNIYLEITFI